MLTIFASLSIFHILVLVGVIPYNIVWGGRLKSETEMYRFEGTSLLIISLFLFFSLVQAQVFSIKFPKIVTKLVLWIMLVLFSLNTVGNLLTKSSLETMIFTPITALLAIFSLILLYTKEA